MKSHSNTIISIFLVIIFVMSTVMTGTTYSYHSKLSTKCVSKNVNIGMNLLLMFNVMLMILPLTYLICYMTCGCHTIGGNINIMIIIISLFMIITGSVIWNGLDTEDNCYNADVKSYIETVVIVSSIILFFSTSYLIKTRIKSTSSHSDEGIEMGSM